jgi:UDP-galactopyranose mutase
MDELSAFLFAPEALKENEARLIDRADLVFTGGNSLYLAKKHLHKNIHCFPSSIDKDHFRTARGGRNEPLDQMGIGCPRIGFFGVIDERLDIDLLKEVAEARRDWQFVLVGPIVKIDPATLPQAPNIHYMGQKPYTELPAYLSGWDIAMMPFANNASTKFISPTKTPEYLAGGKPVIAPSIADVVHPYGELGLVAIADTARDFIQAAEGILRRGASEQWLQRVDCYLKDLSWDNTVAGMRALMEKGLRKKMISSIQKPASYV